LKHYKRQLPRKPRDKHFVGRQIRANNVMCIDHENVNRGIIPLDEALEIAKSSGLDLVQVSPGSGDKVPTCRVIDYSKFKYEQSKKEKSAKKKQRENAIKVKEIKFRPVTGDHDLQVKAKQAQEFVDEGHRVKVTIVFRGREMSHQDVALETLRSFVSMIDGAILESTPSMTGRHMSAFIIKEAAEKVVSA
jgi:translation initiation factor IF-3